MIRHVVTLTFVAGTSDARIAEIEAALATLPDRIPSLRAYSFGRDRAIDEGNAGFGVVADFDDEAGYVAYRDDAEHRRIIGELIRPVLAARSAVQIVL